MKLVLKYNDSVKLFPSQKHFQELINYIQNEFYLKKDSLNLSYNDTDGDIISLMNSEDFDIMLSLFEGKDYIKINVEGEKICSSQQAMIYELDSDIYEEKLQELEDNISNLSMIQKTKNCNQSEQKEKSEETKHIQNFKESLKPVNISRNHSLNQNQSNSYQNELKFDQQLNEKVTRLVDERIQELIPFFMQQISSLLKQSLSSSDLVHDGYICKGCQIKPIIGARYQCPICFNFNLCEKCEIKISHKHHLLKIKKIIQEDQEEQPYCSFVKKIKSIFSVEKKKHLKLFQPSECTQQWDPENNNFAYPSSEQIQKKCQEIALMFGGSPNDYRQFCSKSDGLIIEEIFAKYAELNGISEKQYFNKLTDYKCTQIEKNTGKSRESFKNIVQTNVNLKNQQIVRIISENEENKKKSNGLKKVFNFNNATFIQLPKKQELSQQNLVEKQRKIQSKVFNKQLKKMQVFDKQKKKEQEEQQNLLKKTLQKQTSEIKKQKKAILVLMNDYFGSHNSNQHSKFIQKNFKLGKEEIIELWLKSISS